MSRRRRSASRSRICSGASARGPVRPTNAERDYPMAITRTAMVDDDGSGTTGTIINNAWKTEFYNQIDAALPTSGAWTAIPFNAAHYTAAGGGTWTVGAPSFIQNRYTTIGKMLHWSVFISWGSGASTIAGAVTALQVALPAGLTLGGDCAAT